MESVLPPPQPRALDKRAQCLEIIDIRKNPDNRNNMCPADGHFGRGARYSAYGSRVVGLRGHVLAFIVISGMTFLAWLASTYTPMSIDRLGLHIRHESDIVEDYIAFPQIALECGSIVYQNDVDYFTLRYGPQVHQISSNGAILGIRWWRLGEMIRIDVPIWMIGAVSWAVTTGGLILRRRLQRARRGTCLCCAYDLRGSNGTRCPECGCLASHGNEVVRQSASQAVHHNISTAVNKCTP